MEDDGTELMTGMEWEALTAHEMFLEYCKAGFTENQALKLIAFITKAHFDEPEKEDDE
jgi:hypothetical protein